MLIFAFGSNLSRVQMRRRCPGSVFVGPARLEGFRLAFSGWSGGWGGAVATVVHAENKSTHGAIYVCPPEDVKALDRCEGHPLVYQRRTADVKLPNGRVARVAYYRLDGKRFGPPSARYLSMIHRAYTRLGFDVRELSDSLGYTERMALAQIERDKQVARELAWLRAERHEEMLREARQLAKRTRRKRSKRLDEDSGVFERPSDRFEQLAMFETAMAEEDAGRCADVDDPFHWTTDPDEVRRLLRG